MSLHRRDDIPSVWFGPCEPNLSHVPCTVHQSVSAKSIATSFAIGTVLFGAAPLLVLGLLLWLLLEPKAATLGWFETIGFWFTALMCLFMLGLGISEVRDGLRARGGSRTITFDRKRVFVVTQFGGKTESADYHVADFTGVVLEVTHGELPEQSSQEILLKHPNGTDSILLHKSKGTGLSEDIRERTRKLAQQLDVTAYIEISRGKLEPLK